MHRRRVAVKQKWLRPVAAHDLLPEASDLGVRRCVSSDPATDGSKLRLPGAADAKPSAQEPRQDTSRGGKTTRHSNEVMLESDLAMAEHGSRSAAGEVLFLTQLVPGVET